MEESKSCPNGKEASPIKAQSLAEYALILLLIMAVAVGSLTLLGNAIATKLNAITGSF